VLVLDVVAIDDEHSSLVGLLRARVTDRTQRN
jgi:hypothetical protein